MIKERFCKELGYAEHQRHGQRAYPRCDQQNSPDKGPPDFNFFGKKDLQPLTVQECITPQYH
jgi:hypothetical protein